MTDALPIAAAARALGIRPGTLRRWMREGCPVASRGQRGRGHAVLVDPEAVRTWRAADQRDQVLLELAGDVPRLLAAAIDDAYRQAQGIDKRKLGEILAATWFVGANALLDHLRARCAAVPQLPPELPAQIDRLRKIARG